MGMVRYLFKKLRNYKQRLDPVAYAKKIGVVVGSDCRFVDNPLWGKEPYLITIGNHVLISSEVCFICHDGATWVFREEEEYKDTYKFGRINIGNNCFIGLRSIIMPNVSIGDNCIIGAGSIVTKDIPTGEVWAGNPARFIMKTDEYAKKCYDHKLPYNAEELKKDVKKELLRIM